MSESSRRTTLPDQISVSWHIDDVATIRKDLSKRQCPRSPEPCRPSS